MLVYTSKGLAWFGAVAVAVVRVYLKARFRCLVPMLGGCGDAGAKRTRIRWLGLVLC